MSNLTVRFIELLKDEAPLPIFRFTSDTTIRMRDRQPTTSGVTPTDSLLMESGGIDDYLLLETSSSAGEAYIRGES